MAAPSGRFFHAFQEVITLTNLGELTALVSLQVDEAAALREFQQVEARLKGKLNIPVGIDAQGLSTDLSKVKAELQALAGQGTKASKEQEAASRSLAQQYRAQAESAKAAAAESAASMAKIREQAAQLALTTRLSATADREAAQAGREATRARQEAIDKQRLAYSKLRGEFDAMKISEAEFNRRGDEIIDTLRQMGAQADFTTKELKQLADMEARVSREQNSVAGILNPAGFSGNVAAGLQNALPGILSAFRNITAMSPSLGAAAANVSGIAQAFGEVRVAAQGAAPYALNVGKGMNDAGTAAQFLGRDAGGAAAGLSGIGTAAGVAAAGVGAVAVAVGAAGKAIDNAISKFSAFEYGMARISTLTDKQPGQLRQMGDGITDLANKYGIAARDVQMGMEQILGASVKGTESEAASLQFLETATRMAVGGLTTVEQAADGLTSVLNAYKLSATDAARVSDLMFKTVAVGKISMQELAGSIGMVLPQANDLKIPLEQVFGAVAELTKQGISGSQAIEYLRSAFSNLQKPSEQAAGIAKDLGINFSASAVQSKGFVTVLEEVKRATGGNSETMARLFGDVGALQAVTALTSNGMKDFKKTLDDVAGSAGATDAATDKMMTTLQKKSEQVAQKWESLWKKVGEVFAPFKLEFMTGIDEMLNRVNELLDKFLQARSLNTATNDLAQLERDRQGHLDFISGTKGVLNDPAARASLSAGQVKNMQDGIDKAEAEVARLNGLITTAKAELTQIRAENLQANLRNGTLPAPNTGKPYTGGAFDVGEESGKFGYAYISKLKDVFKNDPKVDSDCAVIASDILNNIGAGIKKSANAGILEKNAVSAGYQKVEGDEIKPGDLIIWTSGNGKTYGKVSGKHAGVAAGMVNGKLMVINNPGSSNTQVEPMYDRQNATVYRSPNSPFAKGGANTEPAPKEGPVTAAMIAKARELQSLMEKAQKAAQAKPGDNALALAYSKASTALKDWTDASDAHKAALAAVTGTQEKNNRSTQDYVATVKDVAKYGNDALRLYKNLEAAQKGGNAQEIAAANTALNTWLGTSRVRKAVLEDEKKAYAARQASAKQTEADAKTAAANRLKTQQDLQAALFRGQEQQAQALLSRLKTQQAKELDLARDSAQKRAQITAQSGPAIIAAEDKLAAIRRDRAVKAAQDEANRAKALPGADLTAVEATRVAAVRQAYATEKQERDKARADQRNAETQANRTALQAQQQHEKERKKLIAQAAQEARELRYQESDATLNRVKADNKAELDAFEGTAAEKLKLIRAQTQEEFEAAEVVARIKKQNRVRELENQYAGKPNDPTFLAAKKLAEQQYADTVAGLKNARIAAIRGAQDDLNRAMQDIVNSPESKGFRDAYTLNLIPGANGFNGTGSDASGLYRYAEQRDALQGIKDAFAGLGDNAADAASIVEYSLIPQVEAIIDKTDDPQLKQAAQDYLKFLKDSKTELLSLAELQDAFNKVRLDAIEAGQSVVAGGEGVLDAFRRQDAQDAMIPGNSTVDVMELLRFDPVAVLDMGETMGQEFIDGVLGSVNGESLSWLGADTLQGLIEAVGSDPKWADFKKKLEESLKLARDLASEVDDLLRQRDAQVGVSGFLPDNTNPADVMTVDADASAQAFDDLRDSIKEMSDEQLKLMTTDPVFAANTEMKSAALAEMKRRADATKEALAQLPAVQAQLELNSLERAHSAGKVGDNWYVGEKERLQTLLENLRFERAIIGKTQAEIEVLTLEHQDKLSAIEDEGRAGRKANAEKADAATLARVKAQNDRELALMEGAQNLQGRLNYINRKQALDEQAAQAEYDTAVKGGKDVETAAATLEAALIRIRQAGSAARQQLMQNELDMLTANFQKAGQIAKMFTDGGENAVSILGDWVTMNTTAYKQFMSGDVAGAVLTTIEGILNAGESLANLNPQLREYKKNMLEIAQLEKEAMGSKKYGNIKNPYYDDLAQDAANREKLGNSKWYQRLWWNLTGSTPQVMEDGAAKLKAKAAEIFGDLADGINTLWNNAWEKAFTDGTTLDLTANLTKMLNLEVAKEAMAQVLEKANIGEYLKAYTDARAAGQDGAAQLEALRQALLKAGQDADAILKTLPGYGEGADPAARERQAAQGNLSNYQAGLKLQFDQGLLAKAEYDRLYLESEHERLRLEMEDRLAQEGLTQDEIARIREEFRLKNAQLDVDAEKATAAERLRIEREVQDALMNNAQKALDLQHRAKLVSDEEYAQRSLQLRLRQIDEEERRAVEAAAGSEELIAAQRERFRLEREAAELDAERARAQAVERGQRLAVSALDNEIGALENRRRARLVSEAGYQEQLLALTLRRIEAQRQAELLKAEDDAERAVIDANFDNQIEAARLAGQEAGKAQSEAYASALSGGFEAMLNGSLKQKIDNSVRQMLMGEIDQQLIAKRLSSDLAPYLDTFRQQISLGLDPTAALAQIASARDGLSASLQVQYQPLIDAFKTYFPENTSALQNVAGALRDTSLTQTTVYEAAPNVAYSSPLRARFARYT